MGETPKLTMNSANKTKSSLPLSNSKLIFDIGMHVGQDTEYYLKKGFRVVAVEANPSLALRAREVFKEYVQNDRLVIINKGISSQSFSSIPFYVNQVDSAWSSFVESIGSRGGSSEMIYVDVISFEQLLDEFGCPYYLKIDIEGLDLEVIKSLRGVNVRPKYLSAENGQEAMIRELAGLGYDSFKFINQAPIGGRKCHTPSREGLEVEHVFQHGSSGEFGEDTPGDWLSLNQVIEVSNRYWSNPNRDANIHGWFDIHARID